MKISMYLVNFLSEKISKSVREGTSVRRWRIALYIGLLQQLIGMKAIERFAPSGSQKHNCCLVSLVERASKVVGPNPDQTHVMLCIVWVP